MIAIAESDGVVCLGDLAAQLGVSGSSLQRPWNSLIDAGLLVRLPPVDSRRRHYSRSESLAWDFALELRSRAASAPGKAASTALGVPSAG
jgi:DNA-binding transcriptional ArsR family regulator